MDTTLLLMLDSHLPTHRPINNELIRLHHESQAGKLIALSMPSLLYFQNEIYHPSFRASSFLDIDRILRIALTLEEESKLFYRQPGLVDVVSLITDFRREDIFGIVHTINSLSDADLELFSVDGVNLFKSIHIDISLCLKCKKIELADSLHSYFSRITLFHIIISLNWLKTFQVSISMIYHTSLYSLNHAIGQYAAIHHTLISQRNCLFQYNGAKIGGFSMNENLHRDLFLRRILYRSFSSSDLASDAIEYCDNYLTTHVCGTSPWSYSPDPKAISSTDPYSLLGLCPSKRLYTYFTSSPDEEYSSDILGATTFSAGGLVKRPFNNEVEAIEALAKEFTRQSSYLIVRFHPRLDKESRVPLRSDSHDGFIEDIEKLRLVYENIVIIRPSDKISSYWLAGWSHKCFSLRSSILYNLGLLGIPFCYLSDNAGLHPSGYDRYCVKQRKEILKAIAPRKITAKDHLDLIYGFYLTSYHATFRLVSGNSEDRAFLFRKSIACGHSILAFLEQPSTDLYCGDDIGVRVFNAAEVGSCWEVYKHLLDSVQHFSKQLSSSNFFPLSYRVRRLGLEALSMRSNA